MSASLVLYRQLVPAHVRVPDATVETWLELSTQQHTAAAWGDVYAQAMVWHTAARLDPFVQGGALGAPGEACAVPKDVAKEVAKANPNNIYWQFYVELRETRAAGAPSLVQVGS